MMFEICRTEDGKASIGQFLEEVQKTGIRQTDPRMENMMKMLNTLKPYTVSSVEDLKLDLNTFKTVLSENVVLITKALQNQMIIPAFDAFCDNITAIYEKCKNSTSGNPANYIPQLAEFDHSKFGVAICTVDGQRFTLGDATETFTIQSTCTPLTYAICLNELGEQLVHEYQGSLHVHGRRKRGIPILKQKKYSLNSPWRKSRLNVTTYRKIKSYFIRTCYK